jgi:hypothetical protein
LLTTGKNDEVSDTTAAVQNFRSQLKNFFKKTLLLFGYNNIKRCILRRQNKKALLWKQDGL